MDRLTDTGARSTGLDREREGRERVEINPNEWRQKTKPVKDSRGEGRQKKSSEESSGREREDELGVDQPGWVQVEPASIGGARWGCQISLFGRHSGGPWRLESRREGSTYLTILC